MFLIVPFSFKLQKHTDRSEEQGNGYPVVKAKCPAVIKITVQIGSLLKREDPNFIHFRGRNNIPPPLPQLGLSQFNMKNLLN